MQAPRGAATSTAGGPSAARQRDRRQHMLHQRDLPGYAQLSVDLLDQRAHVMLAPALISGDLLHTPPSGSRDCPDVRRTVLLPLSPAYGNQGARSRLSHFTALHQRERRKAVFKMMYVQRFGCCDKAPGRTRPDSGIPRSRNTESAVPTPPRMPLYTFGGWTECDDREVRVGSTEPRTLPRG